MVTNCCFELLTVLCWLSVAIGQNEKLSFLSSQVRRLSASACELGYVRATDLDLIWNDAGSGSHADFSCWRPKSMTIGDHTYKPLGDVANRSWGMSAGQLLVAGDVKPPTGFTKVWKDKGSGADKDFSAWLPHDPPGYRCLGHVGSSTWSAPPPDLFACIPEACVNNSGGVGDRIWTDAGSKADSDFSAYALPLGNGYFATHDSHSRKGVFTVERALISEQCLNTQGPLQESCSSWKFNTQAKCPNRCSWEGACVARTDTCSSSNAEASATSCLAKGCNMEWVRKFAPILMFDRGAGNTCYPNNAGDHYDIRMAGHSEQVCNMDEGSMSRGEVETYFEYEECGSNDTRVTVIMYWWWYGYQPPCIDHIVTEGSHPGDWERVLVLLVNGELKRVQFHQHSGAYTVGNYFIYQDTHPVVYVGQLAHGSYHDFNKGDAGLGLECMYFQDRRNPSDPPVTLPTWSKLVYLDFINGPEWMLPSVKTEFLEDTSPPAKRGSKLCEFPACDGSDTYSDGVCLGEACGCRKSCLDAEIMFSDVKTNDCPTEPQSCLTGTECLTHLYASAIAGSVAAVLHKCLAIFVASCLYFNA